MLTSTWFLLILLFQNLLFWRRMCIQDNNPAGRQWLAGLEDSSGNDDQFWMVEKRANERASSPSFISSMSPLTLTVKF